MCVVWNRPSEPHHFTRWSGLVSASKMRSAEALIVISWTIASLATVVDRAQWPRVQFANPRSTISPGHDQTDGPQQTKVLRDCWATGAKIGGNLADGTATAAQQAQDFAPSRIGDRPEHGLASFAPCGHHYSLLSGYQ
jgi:hypothetical protein